MNDVIKARKQFISWARKQGACLIKVGDIELTFPPNHAPNPLVPVMRPTPSISTDAAMAEDFIRNPSAIDDPDYLAQEQDRWASFEPPPKLG